MGSLLNKPDPNDWTKQKQMEELYTIQQYNEDLVYGFIRWQIESNHKVIIPEEIRQLIVNMFDGIRVDFLRINDKIEVRDGWKKW